MTGSNWVIGREMPEGYESAEQGTTLRRPARSRAPLVLPQALEKRPDGMKSR